MKDGKFVIKNLTVFYVSKFKKRSKKNDGFGKLKMYLVRN